MFMAMVLVILPLPDIAVNNPLMAWAMATNTIDM
jgi:hypothetical protein